MISRVKRNLKQRSKKIRNKENINKTIVNGAIEIQKRNRILEDAIKTFLLSPIGINKEKLADLVGTDIQGRPTREEDTIEGG